MPASADDKDRRIEQLEHRLLGLSRRVEKLGGEAVRSEYRVLHLTQEVRRSRQAFGFLTGFQNCVSSARSIQALYDIALKSIIGELWMKRAVVLSRNGARGTLKPSAYLGYAPGTQPVELILPEQDHEQWTGACLVNAETPQRSWVDAVRASLEIPYFVWIPIARNGDLETVLVAGTMAEDQAQEPRLTGHDLDLLTSVGAILWVGRMNLLARGRLERQVRCESLLHGVSELLLEDFDAPTSHFDDVIATVGAGWSLDRVRLLARRPDDAAVTVAHDWLRYGVRPHDTDGTHPLDSISRWQDAMANGETVRIDDVNGLAPEEATGLADTGLRSILLIPITVHRSVTGWSSFEQYDTSRVWSTEDVQLLEVITGLIARAIAREREIEERAQLEAQYYHSKKMEAVGQLAGGIAHDFNNLLTAIQGYAQLLMSRLPEEYRDARGLKEIVVASERGSGLTRQLLTFSRKDAATTGALELNEAVGETMGLLRRMLGDKIRVELDLAEDLTTSVGDRQQICQVIMNLAINARDAMPDGGVLTVATRELPVAGELARRFSIPGIERCQMIEITDTGVGMDQETKERVFDPFFTTKNKGSGTGLGLSIVFSVVRRHGGFIDVQSELGQGTTFSVFLPVRIPEDEENEENRAASEDIGRGHETILVVEDDEAVRTMISEALESHGYKVIAVGNGREALEELDAKSDNISLVLTDVVMPVMGGQEMWTQLSAEGCDKPLIVMSGFPRGRQTEDLLKNAAVYLQKPFGPREITRAVRHTLDSAPQTPRREDAN